ncbi:YhdH/YhfP family quinone oxidoreductase [SAR86 cluster bacterium]|nr:YhdH/YhfP family quinone oxidoreductase [SAR86 cluster bacterium]MDC3144867.1 YhdH/YhfP family quinone oxidoreductase [SAR86 cluster bacterium]
MNFKALLTEDTNEGFVSNVKERSFDDLPDGDVLIKVAFSSLNYKDALSASGNKGVSRNYPHSPGIDAAGVVEQSTTSDFLEGDEVIVTGYDLGMNTSGGFSEYIRVPKEWIIKKPDNLSLEESMAYGTAGLTAGLCVRKILQSGIKPEDGEVFVTGATGGVGIIALMLLAKLGFNVVAITGKDDQTDLLLSLGAKEIINRSEFEGEMKSPLAKPRWAGGVDAVGSDILSNLITATHQRAAIACCGMVGGVNLNTSIFPFILRGLSLLGIDSAETLIEVKKEIWNNFASDWKLEKINDQIKDVGLEEMSSEIEKILKGKQVGRVRLKN